SLVDLGVSEGGRSIQRITITDPDSDTPITDRPVHYLTNQHAGEMNTHWRTFGMVEWLLSDEAAHYRGKMIVHVVPITSPDALSQGWYRVSKAGVDLNRSYRVEGADANKQPHEAYVVQRDF